MKSSSTPSSILRVVALMVEEASIWLTVIGVHGHLIWLPGLPSTIHRTSIKLAL